MTSPDGPGMAPEPNPWTRYRRFRWLLLLSWLSAPPLAACCGIVTGSDAAAAVVMIAAMAVFLRSGLAVGHFRCPRCGGHFFVDARRRDTFNRRCLHCGLPKWEVPPPTAPPGGNFR